MIRTRPQLLKTRQEIALLRERRSALRRKTLTKPLRDLQAASLLKMMRQLQEQVHSYEDAIRGRVRPSVLDRLLSPSHQCGRPRIGEAMFLLRTARRMTQQQLARKLGTRREVVARWERDDYSGYTFENLQRIFEALGCNMALAVRVAG
jgi:DNA-binding Xre family transcriptional regulator